MKQMLGKKYSFKGRNRWTNTFLYLKIVKIMLHSFTEEGKNVADPKTIFFMLCINALELLCMKVSS